jgi:RHS repeat-associated protein
MTGTLPTDFTFTGQRSEGPGLGGLMDYHARHYDPYLNRWIQPDTIVPDPANPQSLNRFSYVLGNPIKYTDPTGHCAPEDEECNKWADRIEQEWEGQVTVVRCVGDWDSTCVYWTADEMGMLYETLNEYSDQYLDIPLTLVRVGDEDYAGLHTGLVDETGKSSTIRIADDAWYTPPAMGLYDLFDVFAKRDYFQGTVAHELTHAAVWSHPELLDRWVELTDIGTHNLFVGLFYDWSNYDDLREENEDAWREAVQEELFAMTVSALMYDPWWNQGRK